jgi:hypothetical protein
MQPSKLPGRNTFKAKLADWKQKENKWGGATATLKIEIESEDPETEFVDFLGMTSGFVEIQLKRFGDDE